MAIVRWDPFRSLMRWPSIWDEEDLGISNVTSDQLDIYETDNEVVVKASVAGVDDDNVEISYEKGVLTISAEETEAQIEKGVVEVRFAKAEEAKPKKITVKRKSK